MARSSHLSLKLLLAALVLASIALAKEAAEAPILSSQVEQCEPIKRLKEIAEHDEEHASNAMRRFFDFLFPFESPGKNAVLATFYISSYVQWNHISREIAANPNFSVPNILLAFIPSEISPSTMNIMTAFAAGGLLSDVFVHLIPHSFMGGEEHGGVQFILVEEKRNVLIGLAVFLGFAFFYATEKLSRTFGGGDEHGHSHSHSHSHSHGSETEVKPSAASSSVQKHASDDLRKRGSNQHADDTSVDTPSSPTVQNGPSKLSAYLNL
ncbi:hypothetical protein FRC00_001070 [Tulasnella sp. 408]|nr:hypothetical protein FRC00_001070 [Tulasnella sp. 408]